MSVILRGAMFVLGLRLLLWMLLLAVDRDHEGAAVFLQSPSVYPSSNAGLFHGDFYGNMESPRMTRSAASGPFPNGNTYSRATPSTFTGTSGLRGFQNGGRNEVFGGRTDLNFPSRGERYTGFSRPIPAGYGNPFDNNQNLQQPSAFKNLFGVNIGESAGIYDSFGKPKPPISSQTRPRENFELVKDSDIASSTPGLYKTHPFSSIRLSPVTHVSGAAVQSPTGDSPFNEHDDFRDRSGMFSENRALNYKHNDPFERPISRSAFPLPSVNEPITLDLAQDEQDRVKYVKDKKQLPPIRKLEENPGGGKGANGATFPQDSSSLQPSHHALPPDAFGWQKPPSVPELPPMKPVGITNQNSSVADDKPHGDGKLMDALKGTDGVHLPELSGAGNGRRFGDLVGKNLKENQAWSSSNNTITGKQGTSQVNDGDKDNEKIAVPKSGDTTSNDGKIISNRINDNTLPSGIDELGDFDSDSRELFSSESEESTSSEKDGNKEDSNEGGEYQSSSESNEVEDDFGISSDHDSPPGNSAVGHLLPDQDKELNLPDNPKTPGRYDVTVLTDEEITKKSGDLEAVLHTRPSPSDVQLESVPNDVPATKRVLERTIENGKQRIVANETELPTDHVGFILTDDLYDDQQGVAKHGGDSSDRISSQHLKQDKGVYIPNKNTFLSNQDTGDPHQEIYHPSNPGAEDQTSLEQHQDALGIISQTPGRDGRGMSKAHSDIRNKIINAFETDPTRPEGSGPAASEGVSDTVPQAAQEPVRKVSGDSTDAIPTEASYFGPSERPPVGSGYLMYGFEPGNAGNGDSSTTPVSAFHYPETKGVTDDNGFVYANYGNPARGTEIADSLVSLRDVGTHTDSDSRDEFHHSDDGSTENSDKSHNASDSDTPEPRLGVQRTGTLLKNEKETIGDSSDHEGDGDAKGDVHANRAYDGLINPPDIIVEQEHVDLENLKEYTDNSEDETLKDKLSSSSPTSSSIFSKDDDGGVDEVGLNDFSDYNFNAFGKKEYPFTYDSKDEFSINTDPASLNFDLVNAGEGNINIHRTSQAFKPDSQQIHSLENDVRPTDSAKKETDYIHEEVLDSTGELNQDGTSTKVLGDEQTSEDRDTLEAGQSDKNHENNGATADSSEQDKESAPAPTLETDELYSDKFIDYSNYYDPYYDYNYGQAPPISTRNPTSLGSGAPPSSSFMASPFESMFGKSVDQAEQGQFGSLFQNLAHAPAEAGGAKGGGRDLFDKSLSAIIQRRPSLDLFGRGKRRR